MTLRGALDVNGVYFLPYTVDFSKKHLLAVICVYPEWAIPKNVQFFMLTYCCSVLICEASLATLK